MLKLSMWMLADRLSRYNPRLWITTGEATVSGLRIFTEELQEFSPEYLYIGPASNVFNDVQYVHGMILVHRYDLMLIDNITIEDLLNEILQAFDFYNAWESSLGEASLNDEPIQAMVTASGAVFDSPVVIMNKVGAVIAYSKSFSRDAFNDFWRELVDTRISPTGQFGVGITTREGTVLSEWLKKPQAYMGDGRHPDYIAANIEIDGEFVGAFLLLGFRRELKPHYCQLAGRLCTAIAQAAVGQGGNFELPSNALLFRELLESGCPTPRQVHQLSEGWFAPWHMLVIKSVRREPTQLRKNTSLDKIRRAETRTVALLFGSEILVLVDAAALNRFLRELKLIINPEYFAVGISLQFSTWADLPERRSQALFALENNGGEAGVFYCRDYAFEHMISTYRGMSSDLLMLHPAPETLREYDRIYKTEFSKTLYVYLANDRNIVNTASALHVHRNTLLYRIKKIMKIIDTELEDSDERIYIQMSYKIGFPTSCPESVTP